MTDNVVSNKFTGDSSSAVKAIAELEKAVEKLNKSMVEGKSAAKSAAIASRQAAKEHAEDVALDAKNSRRIFRQTIAELKKEERESANESRRVFRQTTRALAMEERQRVRDKRKAAKERRDIEREEAQADSSMLSWVKGIGSAALAYTGISSILSTIISKHDEMIQKSDEHGQALDRMTRKLRTQLSLTGEEGKQATDRLSGIAVDSGVDPEIAIKAAIALGGQGFSNKESTGSAAKMILDLQTAGNEAGEDPNALIEAASQIMRNRGLDMTTQNLADTMIPLQRISKPLNLKLSDSPQWAGKSSQISEALNDPLMEDALQGQMRSYADATVAGSANKALVQRLQTMRNDKQAMKWLNASKVSPDKMDLIGGESLPQALDAVDEVLKKTKATDVPSAIEDMFGKEFGPLIQRLVKDREKLKGLRDVAGDTKGFYEDLKPNREGSSVLAARSKALSNQQIAERATDEDAILDTAERFSRAEGVSETAISAKRTLANTSRATGGSLDTAVRMIVGDDEGVASVVAEAQKLKGNEPLTGLTPDWADFLKSTMDANTKAVEKNNQLLEQQNAQNKQPPAPVPAQPKRPTPVNASE